MSPLIEYPLLEGYENLRSIAAHNSSICSETVRRRLKAVARGIPRNKCCWKPLAGCPTLNDEEIGLIIQSQAARYLPG
jgi:hypothetical protein